MDRFQNTDLSSTPPEPTTGETGYLRQASPGNYEASAVYAWYFHMLVEELRNVVLANPDDPTPVYTKLDQVQASIAAQIKAATPDSAETVKGLIRRATVEETISGLVNDAAATPAGVKAAIAAIPTGMRAVTFTESGQFVLPEHAVGVLVFGVGPGGGGGAGADNGHENKDGGDGGDTTISTGSHWLSLGGGKGGKGGGPFRGLVEGYAGEGGAAGTAMLFGLSVPSIGEAGTKGLSGNPAAGGNGGNSPFGTGGVGTAAVGVPTQHGSGYGAGGAGGWGQDGASGGGGGAGAYVSGLFLPAYSGATVYVTIGAPGAGAVPTFAHGEGGQGAPSIVHIVPVIA